MVAQTPVVATRIGGIVDVVRDEETGLLVDERTPEQIARAVTRLWQDADLRSRLASTAYARVVERFSRRTSAQSFSTLFEELIRIGKHESR
jgi:glycosyltransferase involved in cell wall biosynthesis